MNPIFNPWWYGSLSAADKKTFDSIVAEALAEVEKVKASRASGQQETAAQVKERREKARKERAAAKAPKAPAASEETP